MAQSWTLKLNPPHYPSQSYVWGETGIFLKSQAQHFPSWRKWNHIIVKHLHPSIQSNGRGGGFLHSDEEQLLHPRTLLEILCFLTKCHLTPPSHTKKSRELPPPKHAQRRVMRKGRASERWCQSASMLKRERGEQFKVQGIRALKVLEKIFAWHLVLVGIYRAHHDPLQSWRCLKYTQ